MASIYSIPSQSHITDQQNNLYADAARGFPSVPQSHHPSLPPQQNLYPDPHAHLQFQAQSQAASVQIPPQSHGPSFDSHQQQPLQHQEQQPLSQSQMQQHFNGYNPNNAGSMPPPSTMGAMNTNIGATMQQGMPQRTPQSYQAQMRSSNQRMSPSSPGFMQSPTSFTTPTPPTSAPVGQPFVPQSSLSPTKQIPPTSVPTSHPQMGSSVSPQNAINPTQKPGSGTSTDQVPLSPESQKKETQKIDLLLEINRVLFQEIVQLQAAGRGVSAQNKGSESSVQGGQQSPTAADGGKDTTADAKDSTNTDGEPKPEAKPEEKDKDKKNVPAKEYIECMRRLQANFAYLTNLVSRPQKPQDKIIERPPIMEAIPPNIEGNIMSEENQRNLREMYASLKQLFPAQAPAGGAVAATSVPAAGQQRPGPAVGAMPMNAGTDDQEARMRAAQQAAVARAQAAHLQQQQQQQMQMAQAQMQGQMQGQLPPHIAQQQMQQAQAQAQAPGPMG